ncbi:MAG: HigA family addiction module antitoxin [Thermodesulfobacteriota bacterium]
MRERKRPPVHPGRIPRNHYLTPLSLPVTELAGILGVSRKTASKIINERGAITADMALRLARAFDTTPGLWLGLQQEYDLWRAERTSRAWRNVRPVDLSRAAAT